MQRKKSLIGLARGMLGTALLAMLTGCLSHPEPLIDTQGVNMAQFEQDLEYCMGYGDQVRVEKGVAKGAAADGAIRRLGPGDLGDDQRWRPLGATRRAGEITRRQELHAVPGVSGTELIGNGDAPGLCGPIIEAKR